MSQWDYRMQPPSGQHDPHAGGYTDGFDEDGTSPYPVTWERDPYEPATPGAPRVSGAPRASAMQRLGLADEGADEWAGEDWLPRHRRRAPRGGGRARLLVLALVVAAGASAGVGFVLTSGNPGGKAPAPKSPALQAVPPPPGQPGTQPGQGSLTMTQASQVLAAYTSANNAANAQRSDAALAAIETGSSYTVDAGIYRAQQAENAAPYAAFGPQLAQYYIPRETAYPRWFVVQVTNAELAAPAKVTGTEYLLFTQAVPGAPWKNTVEPYVVAGATTPPVALGADGLATPVTAATPLAVPVGQIAQVTASSLDGAGPLPQPGNLADVTDRGFWQRKLPGSSVTDAHAPDSGAGAYGLLTAGGGALLFYTDAAELTLTAPAGEAMHLTIPGFYSPGQALSRAGIGYLEQFATYDPPSGGSGLRVIADYSAITSGT